MKIRITHQGSLVKISPQIKRTIHPHIFGRGDRNVTTSFTDRSRKNLLEKFAVIDQKRAKNATFITLTYVENMQDHKKAQRDIDTFFKRLLREKENIFAVWKKEIQVRGAIHFHIMVWNLPFLHKERIAQEWGEITNSWEIAMCSDGEQAKIPPFTRIEYCKSPRKCWYYLSKYVAKVDRNQTVNEFGEITVKPNVKINSFPVTEGNSSGFNYGTNPTALAALGICDTTPHLSEGEQPEVSTGRWWGWINRKAIPYADIAQSTIELTWAEYRRFRWDLRRVFGHTSQVDDTHEVKIFWFEPNHDPFIMLMQGKNGNMVFKEADKWEQV